MLAAESNAKPLLRVGLMTDLPYEDKDSTTTRYHREALRLLLKICFLRESGRFGPNLKEGTWTEGLLSPYGT